MIVRSIKDLLARPAIESGERSRFPSILLFDRLDICVIKETPWQANPRKFIYPCESADEGSNSARVLYRLAIQNGAILWSLWRFPHRLLIWRKSPGRANTNGAVVVG